MTDTYNTADCDFFKREMRNSLRYAASWRRCSSVATAQYHAAVWRERAADYRECLIDQMRRRQGWTLAERVAGRKAS